MGYYDALPPDYQKIREAVSKAMGLLATLVVRSPDGTWTQHDIVYLSPKVETLHEIWIWAKGEAHNVRPSLIANRDLIHARHVYDSIMLSEGFPSIAEEEGRQETTVKAMFFDGFTSVDGTQIQGKRQTKHWLASFDAMLKFRGGWDDVNEVGYRLHKISCALEHDKAESARKNETQLQLYQRVAPKQRMYQALRPLADDDYFGFSNRTQAMIRSIEYVKRSKNNKEFKGDLHIEAGLAHLFVFHPDDKKLDLSGVYAALRDTQAIVTYPICLREVIRQLFNEFALKKLTAMRTEN